MKVNLTGALWFVAVGLLGIAVGLGAGDQQRINNLPVPKGQSVSRKAQENLEKIAARDPRIEVLARAICAARGINPDYQGFPYPPGPVWETFILQARDLLAELDAYQHLKPP